MTESKQSIELMEKNAQRLKKNMNMKGCIVALSLRIILRGLLNI